MTYTLGFSPCPNDTFIFDALVNKKIDTGEMEFDVVLEDVQTLNQWAIEGKLDFSKISYGVLPLVLEQYVLLSSGGALGKGVGPLLISLPAEKEETSSTALADSIKNNLVVIPGKNTTAHLLFSLAFPEAQNKQFRVFNEIEDAVLNKEAYAGVIIHENRFTYHLKGLYKLMDLGEYWETVTGVPIPLGGIVGKRSIDAVTIQKVDELIRQSVAYAYKHHHKELADYVKQHAQEMSEEVMRQHINLYVNDYSLNLGEGGRNAVLKLIDVYEQQQPSVNINRQAIFAG